MNLKNLPKVPYRILNFSSEDPNYQHTELLHQGPQCKGWQSQRYCEYPQELILELSYPTQIQYMQFLSHQCKIATKVEIYAFLPKTASLKSGADYSLNPAEIRFTKIGYFYFNSNETTNFQSRELKTVYLVDISALYIKVTLHQCHNNKLNTWNQVGIIAISVFGNAIATNPVAPPRQGNDQEGYQELEYNMQFDEETLAKLRLMEKARHRAEEVEDYAEAKKLNEAIENLKRVGVNLQRLEVRRATAVKNRDYDSAAVLKKEIDSLRRAQFSNDNQFFGHPGGQGGGQNAKGVNGAQIGNTYGGEAIDNYGQKGNQPMAIRGGGGARATSGNGIDNFKSRGGSASGPGMDRDDGRVPADKMPKHVPAEATDWPEDIGKPKPKGVSRDQSYTSSQTPGGPGSRAQVQPGMHNESQVIPALKNKAPKDFNKAGIDDDPLGDPVGDDNGISLQNAEEIRLADSSKAQPLIPYLSEMLVKGIFSKNWNIRDQAVKVMSQEIVKGGKSEMLHFDDQANLYVAIIGALGMLINDKIVQVSISAMNCLLTVLQRFPAPPVSNSPGFKNNIDELIVALIIRIGESKQNIKDLAQDCVDKLGEEGNTGPALIASLLYRTKGLPKVCEDFKHLCGRLESLSRLTIKFGFGPQGIQLDNTVEFAIKNLENSSNEVRQAASDLILEALKLEGEQRIEPMLENVRQNIKDTILSRYQDYLEVPQDNLVRDKMTENRNKRGKSASKAEPAPTSGQSKRCGFCGQTDPNFQNGDKYDMHLFKECPMLVQCKFCGAVQQISGYTDHLLSSMCSGHHKQCPRCKLAIPRDQYDNHVRLMACPPARRPEEAGRCPLCATDIPPGPQGWVTHIMTDGCPNNERTLAP